MENMNRKIGYIIVIAFWLIILSLIPSCALTYEHPKCHLMLQGKSCLPDHSCCNPQTYNHINCIDCNHNRLYNPNWYWWSWNKPTYTNYVILKPNNKPNNRPSFNNNSNNSNNSNSNNNSNKPSRKPRK